MIQLNIKSQLFPNSKYAFGVFEAEYSGEPCHAVRHFITGHTEIFDYDRAIVAAVINRAKAGKLQLRGDKSRLISFGKTETDSGISLRLFLYAKYNNKPLLEVKGKHICLMDESAGENDIIDLRSRNLYDPGSLRELTNARRVEVVNNGEDSLIKLSMLDGDAPLTEFVQYDPELFRMLGSPSYCNIQTKDGTDRVTVGLTMPKSIHNIGHFVAVFKNEFEQFRGMQDAIKRFIQAFPELSKKYEGMDAAHINARKNLHLFDNLLFMDKKTNQAMYNYAARFGGNYGLFATLDDGGEILSELMAGKNKILFKCSTPEDYADLQKALIGELPQTKKLQRIAYNTPYGVKQAFTPRGMVVTRQSGAPADRCDAEEAFNWIKNSRRLNALPESSFFLWKAEFYKSFPGVLELSYILSSICDGIEKEGFEI